MKRSEMLKLIINVIDDSCGNENGNRVYPSDEYLAERILETIEESGMYSLIDLLKNNNYIKYLQEKEKELEDLKKAISLIKGAL